MNFLIIGTVVKVKWTTASNWGLNVVPTADKSPVVDNVGNSPLISTNVNIRDLNN